MRKLLLSLALVCLALPAWSQVSVQNLPSGSTPTGANYTICDQSAVTNKCTFAQVLAYIQANLTAVGTVTSVSITAPSLFTLSGCTITTSGTCAFSYSGTALPVANGGTGTSSPGIVAGTNVTVTGTWPNQTINSSGGGGSGTVNSGTSGCLAYYASTGTAVSPLSTCSSTILADLQAATTFTMAGTGCTPTSATGGPFGGTFTLATGPCTAVTITMNGATGFTAAHGYNCTVTDQTTQAAGTWIPAWGQKSSTTTAAVLPIPAAAGTSDVISFNCSYN